MMVINWTAVLPAASYAVSWIVFEPEVNGTWPDQAPGVRPAGPLAPVVKLSQSTLTTSTVEPSPRVSEAVPDRSTGVAVVRAMEDRSSTGSTTAMTGALGS